VVRAATAATADVDADTRQSQAAARHEDGRHGQDQQTRAHLAAPFHAMPGWAEAAAAMLAAADIEVDRIDIADAGMHARGAEAATRQQQDRA
jgi:hypothetical protein